ncbi:cobalt transporter [Rhodobacterales bacterium 52_120_T64]|nr:cobalt transporter [Rhodobacterales bacterium 52_120_T64]
MTTATHSDAKTDSNLVSIVFAAFLGLSVLFIAGFASSATLHDTAHDMRHAIGFACH